MPNSHTQGFKEQAVQKTLAREGESIKSIAQRLNIGYSTLQNWMREYRSMTPDKESQCPHEWSRKQQFQALMDTASMDPEACHQYCREKGLFPHHLNAWHKGFIGGDQQTALTRQADVTRLKKENISLQKELRRKEKALAETAALLVLQKKFHALLEEKDE